MQAEDGIGLIELLAAMVVLSIALLALRRRLRVSGRLDAAGRRRRPLPLRSPRPSSSCTGPCRTPHSGSTRHSSRPRRPRDTVYASDHSSLDDPNALTAGTDVSSASCTPLTSVFGSSSHTVSTCVPIQTVTRRRWAQLPRRDIRPRRPGLEQLQHHLDRADRDRHRPRPEHHRLADHPRDGTRRSTAAPRDPEPRAAKPARTRRGATRGSVRCSRSRLSRRLGYGSAERRIRKRCRRRGMSPKESLLRPRLRLHSGRRYGRHLRCPGGRRHRSSSRRSLRLP